MKHISQPEFEAMQREASDYFTVHDFLEWLQSIKGEVSRQSPQVQADLAEIEALLKARKAMQ